MRMASKRMPAGLEGRLIDQLRRSELTVLCRSFADELIMLDDERVDINTYKAPLREVYTGVPPPKAFSDRDFATRLDYNSRIPRGLEVRASCCLSPTHVPHRDNA